jgi:Leucine-rich repeat (LRR) protein
MNLRPISWLLGALLASGCSNDPAPGAHVARLTSGAPFRSIAECVDAHVRTKGGDPCAVEKLDCPDPTSSCTAPPTDLSALAPLHNLTAANLTGRCITDLGPIPTLTHLERLELAHNAVDNLRPLRTLTRLTYLGLADNGSSFGATWDWVMREPFVHLQHLEELVLDGVAIDNLIPIASAKNLRTLSLRRHGSLDAITPLAALTKLRVLHLDGSEISDLSPLADMTTLRELTADDTLVSTIAPLRPLLGQRLRRLSVRRSCVASCDPVSSTAIDCSDPKPATDCYDAMQFAAPRQYAVPVELVERFAPSDLPIWTAEQLARGFEMARTAPDIDWKNARGSCEGRAGRARDILLAAGFPAVTRVSALGNLRPLTTNDPAGFLAFGWHIAPLVRARVNDTVGFFVLDPALDDARPLPLRAWYARLEDSSGGSLDVSCARYHSVGPSGSSPGSCPRGGIDPETGSFVDERGDLTADPVSRLFGAICPADSNYCLTP